jgi:hypothetical protein
MPLNPSYFTEQDWQEVTLDKDTGAPLAGGLVYFWQDDNRLIPKLVYELVNLGGAAPPNYTYMPLPNPIQLSGVGSPMDANGNDVAVYYYPYDASGNIQLYYIQITNSLGVAQFVREAWPNLATQIQPINNNGIGNPGNQILNAQFVDVNFIPTAPLIIPYTAPGTTTVAIAVGWNLTFTNSGAGFITVTRTAIAGNLQYPGNPPYTITVTPGANLTAISLTQQLTNNPNIFSPAIGGLNGYIAGSILLGPASSIIMSYQADSLALQQILNANNVSANFEEFDATIQLTPAANPNTDFSNIVLTLPTVAPTTFSNVQVVTLATDQNILFQQQTANIQRSLLFNYYNPLLQFKPIPSYLIGWDFALNPAQFLSSTVAAFATGANTSNYVWDNTIVFQSVSNSFTTARGPSGNLQLTTTANTQLAIIQYIPAPLCKKILSEYISSMAEAATNQVGGYPVTISIWQTTNVNLPSIAGTTQSFVTGLDANGHPNAVVAGWLEVPRSNLGAAQFTLQVPGTQDPNVQFNYYPFSEWISTAAVANAATYMAIVVGTGVITSPNIFSVQSASLQSGKIATIPAPISQAETLVACQHYYRKSFIRATVPTTAAGLDTGELYSVQFQPGGTACFGFDVKFQPSMYRVPVVVLYNPISANNQIRNTGIGGGDWSGSGTFNLTQTGFDAGGTTGAGTQFMTIAVHYTADARLGV